MSILCLNHYGQNFQQLVYRSVYCVLTYLISAVRQNALQIINVSELLTLQVRCKAPHTEKSTGLRY